MGCNINNLCFEAKIRKIEIPLHTHFYYIIVEYKGVHYTDMLSCCAHLYLARALVDKLKINTLRIVTDADDWLNYAFKLAHCTL